MKMTIKDAWRMTHEIKEYFFKLDREYCVYSRLIHNLGLVESQIGYFAKRPWLMKNESDNPTEIGDLKSSIASQFKEIEDKLETLTKEQTNE